MMNIKNRYSDIRLRDERRAPWRIDCDTFKNLESMCNAVRTCRRDGSGKLCHKLTKFTADAFVVTTTFNIAAATHLHTDHHFRYVLPALFSQVPLDKFF